MKKCIISMTVLFYNTLWVVPTCAGEDGAFLLWQKSVLSAFKTARAHEIDIVKGVTAATPRFPDLDALMPDRDALGRIQDKHYVDLERVTECRDAVLKFRWLAGDREDARSLYEPRIAQDLKDYVGSARRCEVKFGLKPSANALRIVADAIKEK